MPEYLTTLDVLGLHQEIMRRYGQSSELREGGEASIESSLMRPQWAARYQDADLAQQTALLMLGIAQAHPFVDGNKRVAFAAGTVFMQLNGFIAESARGKFAVQLRAALEASNKELGVQSLANWLRSRLQPL
jgi:death-on-curing protein